MDDMTALALILGLLFAAAFFAIDRWDQRRKARAAQAQLVADRLLGKPAPEQAQAAIERRTLWDAMMEHVLPHTFHPTDPAETRTYLRVDIRTRLSFADRLRLLLTGDMRVLATVYTDVEVREARTLANIEIHPFKE